MKGYSIKAKKGDLTTPNKIEITLVHIHCQSFIEGPCIIQTLMLIHISE